MNEQLDEFGEQRLVETVAQLKDGAASHIREGIIQAVDRFVQDAPQHDDITLVTLKAT